MIVEILATGNEVVDGEVLNSNASWLSRQMRQQGFEVKFHSAVPDDEGLIAQALQTAVARANIVLVTGGLGPTVDDLTLEVAARTFGRPLELHEASLQRIRSFFERLGRSMTVNQEKQAQLPRGCTPLANAVGTAPGAYWLESGVHLAFFPGVPKEMEVMFQREFLPKLPLSEPREFRLMKSLRCFGLPEGQMDQLLRPILSDARELEGVRVGFRVRFPTVDIRLETAAENLTQAQSNLDKAVKKISAKLGEHIFGEAEVQLEESVGKLLSEKNLSLATAESCTGGLLANLITNVPGASRYFLEGAVTYSNQAKIRQLGVSPETLQQFGAVSRETALEMARGIRHLSGADFGVAITGIAGPSGGSDQKPVGTVHISVAYAEGEWEQEFHFPFDRLRFKQLVAATALDKLRRLLMRGL